MFTQLSEIAPGEWFTDLDGERWMKTDYHADNTLCNNVEGEHAWKSPDGMFDHEPASSNQVPATAARPGEYYVPVCVTVADDHTVTARVDSDGSPWMFSGDPGGTRWDGDEWGDATADELIEIDAKLAEILSA